MYRIPRISLFIILTLSFFFSIQTLDKKYPRQTVESFLYLPSGTFLKGAALGYDEMLGDMLWIKAVGYFGGHAGTDRNYTWLAHLLDVVTTLDPLYQYPYEFGGVVLAAEVGDVNKSIALLKKGMKNVSRDDPRYWYFPFFLAYDYMYHKDDYLTAAHYLEQAVKFPQSPAYLPRPGGQALCQCRFTGSGRGFFAGDDKIYKKTGVKRASGRTTPPGNSSGQFKAFEPGA